jgi:hypothetical protein
MSQTINFDRIDGLYTDHQRRIAGVIRDMYPTVRLLKLEYGHPEFNPDKPFALVDEPNLLAPYVIMTLHESQIDHRLIARLVENDTQNANSKVNKLELLQQAEALVQAKAEADWEEEKKDILRSMMKSKKSTYTHQGKTLRK